MDYKSEMTFHLKDVMDYSEKKRKKVKVLNLPIYCL